MDASIKRRIIRKVEGLDNEKLLQLYIWLGLDEEDDSLKSKERNLALAGVWKTVPDLVFNAVLKEIYNNRKSKKL
jgi:hypothetical protein